MVPLNDGEEQMVVERKDRHWKYYDVDVYAHLISTGFISEQTVTNLAYVGQIAISE